MRALERFVSVQDGRRLFVRDEGPLAAGNTPVLCLPGLTRNGSDFEELARHLAKQRRVVRLDYRGRGRSERDPDWRNYRPSMTVADTLQTIAALDLHRILAVGTSFGGGLAMALAVAGPLTLAGAVLNDIAPDIEPRASARILDYVAKDRPQRDWESAIAFLQSTLPNLPLRSEDDWLRFAKSTYRQGSDGLLHYDWDTALARPFREEKPADLRPLFRALARHPILAIRGALSDVVSEAAFATMAAAKPDLRRVVVPEVGHAPALDEPPVLEAIDALLDDLDRARH
ncbi:MAG: alpha/beta fold hydrolase [Kiloniellales bacterium]